MAVKRIETGSNAPSGLTPAKPGANRRPYGFARMILLLVLAILIALVIGVVWLLPGYVDEVPVPVAEVSMSESKPAPPSETETALARARREAERTLQEVLHQQAILEAQDVVAWAGAAYEKTLHTLAAGDAAFSNGDFDLANEKYTDVVEQLKSLERSKPQRLQDALALGAAALAEYDEEEATRQFQVALALSPDNKDARNGARRTENIAELGAMLGRARKLEQDGDWSSALERYQAAFQLDAESLAAQQGIEQMQAELEREQFSALMSEALLAVQDNRFDAARQALSKAAELQPQSRDVRDAQTRLELAVQEFRITAHRDRAAVLMRQERWHEAIVKFAAVLAIDPQAQFAVLGLSRSRRLAALHDQLDNYIDHPGRLQFDEPRSNVHKLLIAIESMQETGPLLSRKFIQLSGILEQAETPVRVPLHSDGLTDVSVDRVGAFGRFEESSVTLLPGEYVARGVRPGYRDVRINFSVEPGGTSPPLVVKCEEGI